MIIKPINAREAGVNEFSANHEASHLYRSNLNWIYTQNIRRSQTTLVKQIKFSDQIAGNTVLWLAEFSTDNLQLNPNDYQDALIKAKLTHAKSKRQAEFLASRQLAHIGLSRLGSSDTFVGRNSQGLPVWPKGVHGSISHHKNSVAVILGKSPQRLGVDIESPLLGISLLAIQKRILSTEENRLLSIYSPNDESLLTTLIFSAKESLYKAIYPESRLAFDIRFFELESPPDNGKFKFRLLHSLAPSLKKNQTFSVNYSLLNDTIITWVASSKFVPPKK
ncbi:enterobactin synthetase component D [Vibrio crassostreae]|nr:enterobactin synthetase component D [Vibrio crassostreae]